MPPRRLTGFTLIELAIVVLVLSLLSAAALRYSANITATNNNNALNKTLDVIETALMNFRNTYSRLPCPADITQGENQAFFGIETDTTGSGTCANGASPQNHPNFTDGNYMAEGAVPTKTLKIDDKYAYDPWGRRIYFAIDMRASATGAFTTYLINNTTLGTLVIKDGASPANTITQKAIYTLMSAGPNGHGAYLRYVGDGASDPQSFTRYNAGSTNANELANCNCDSGAGTPSWTFSNVFIQAPKTDNSTDITKTFDDVVRFKTRAQMANYTDLQ